jgi:hypothetical protein
MQLSEDDIQRLMQRASLSIKPVWGAGETFRSDFQGTATIVRDGSHVVLLTAEHVLHGLARPSVAINETGSTGLIPNYGVLRDSEPNTGSPDIAFVFLGDRSELRPDLSVLLEYKRSITLTEPFAPVQFLIAGFPASKARLVVGDKTLLTKMMFVAVEAKPRSWYEEYGYDPTTHIAVTYDRDNCRNIDGVKTRGAAPNGMSGGPILIAGLIGGEPALYPAGIFIEYHADKGDAMIGVRLNEIANSIADPAQTHPRRWIPQAADIVSSVS